MLIICFIFICILMISCDVNKGAQVKDLQNDQEDVNRDHFKEKQQQVKEKDQKVSTVTFAFAGDTMGAGKVAPILTEKGYEYPLKIAKPFLENADIAMVNLETPISVHCKPANKTYAYQTHPIFLKGLKWAGIDIVSLANNHSLDCGRVAFHETLQGLKDNQIKYVGGGLNKEEAYRSERINMNGKEINILAFSRVLPEVSWYAKKNQSGVASGYQEKRMYDLVSKASQEADMTVIYLHWGNELADIPEKEDQKVAHQLIDLGADLVIGSHPHVLQGFEFYKEKLIAYSLGNFIFTTSHQEIARQTGVLTVKVQANGVQKVQLTPMKIERGAVWAASGQEKEVMLNRLNELSNGGQWSKEFIFLKD